MNFLFWREKRSSIEDPRIPVSAENFLHFFGVNSIGLPSVSIDSALTVPAVAAAVSFLSRTLAALPLHAYRQTKNGPERIGGKLETVIHEAPNDFMDSFKFRQYLWQQVFTGGRAIALIERGEGGQVEALFPIDPASVNISRREKRIFYRFDGKDHDAIDVIDLPFMLKGNQLGHHGPINMATKAIQLSLAMNDYASGFFAGGGVPPLALTGPLPAGNEAMRRAVGDISRAIDEARRAEKPIFMIPPGYDLKQVGFDPEKGQMTDARRFQVEEIARAYQLPPVFLQDLSHASFSNAEQQDLHLVKHLIGQWAKAFEGELNLKLFGRLKNNRYVEHNLDGLMRGDFKSRIDGIARAIQGGFMEPNRGRGLMNWPDHENPAANDLFIQGATVPLGSNQVADGASNNDTGTPGADTPA